MALINQDFVDREEPLRFLHQAVQQLNCRIVLIQGRAGIGKTTLLREFLEEARKAQTYGGVLIDLQQPIQEQNYLTIILEFQRQFGYAGFEHLERALVEARSALEPIQTLRAPTVWEQNPADSRPSPQAKSGNAGIIFQGPVEAPNAQFAGGNIINFHLHPYSTPYEQAVIRANITRAFLEDLAAINQQRKIVLAFDHWESANHETRDWLWETLLQWTIYQLSPMVMFVASQDLPEWYQKREEIASFELSLLPEEAVRLYWIGKRNLPEARLASNLPLYGYPSLMVLAADELTRQLQQRTFE